MRWKIKAFVFCEQQQSLSDEHNSVRIEPMMCELLAYFCRHQGSVVSKEQLLDEVWHGRFVSDNTVSKLVTKLRKALQDDARNPEYIVTIPKRGYRFIASAVQIDEATAPEDGAYSVEATSSYSLRTLIAVMALVCVAVAWWLLSPNSESTAITTAKAITSDRGSEDFPAFSPDGKRLAYMHHDGDRFRLLVKQLDTGETVEVNHGDGIGVGPGYWNDTGSKLVYLVATSERCQYFTREFNGIIMSEPQLIHTCNTGSYGGVKFTHDDNVVVFAESPGQEKPYSLYRLVIDTGEIQWLPQPELHLGGNSQFDIHPFENKLLISSPDENQWEGFYQLDMDSQELTLLFRLNAYICCGIWSHDGEHVVLMGEHPAREIIQYDLTGKHKTVLFVGPQQIRRPKRHSNGVDYTFSAYTYDLNVDAYSISGKQSRSLLNDTFDERLPVFSPQSDRVAYISLTTGSEELWLYDLQTGMKSKITEFADGRHYVDLAWSPDEKHVAALTLNAIHIIDLQSGHSKVLPVPEKELRGISFKSPSELAFSVRMGERWQVVVFNLNSNAMFRLDPQWQSVQFDISPANWLWVNQQQEWFQGEDAEPLAMPGKSLSPFLGRQFAVKKSGDVLAVFDWSDGQLEVYKTGSTIPIATLESQTGHFSVSDDSVLINRRASALISSDIYQTYQVSGH